MLDSYSMKITPLPAQLDCVNSDITISLSGSPRIPVYDFSSIALPSSVGKEYQRWCRVVKRRFALPLVTGQLKRTLGFPRGASGKESTCQCRRCKRRRFDLWVGLQEGMAIHSSILAWRIPWTEEPGRLRPIGLQRVGHY